MNIYRLSQSYCRGYDTYDSCIVVAKNKEEAKTVHPSDYAEEDWYTNAESSDYSWPHRLKDIRVEYLGTASTHFKEKQLILASFNAG